MERIEDYLLDNNIISIVARINDPRRPEIVSRIAGVTGKIWLPVVAIAEIRAGLARSSHPGHPERVELENFLARYGVRASFDEHAIEPYALIRAQLWKDHATPRSNSRSVKEKLPEELVDRVSGKSLGIDERDLLIASTAIAYNLVLATNDKNGGMKRIEAAALKLQAVGEPVRLRVEYWGHGIVTKEAAAEHLAPAAGQAPSSKGVRTETKGGRVPKQ